MDAQGVLKQYFGYDKFLGGQERTISAILRGQDALAVMPTGAGKSACYQVPAMLLEGITLVISPLISLMQDQVKALNKAGIRAAFINSSLTETQIAKALSLAARGMYKIVYVAPERLDTVSFRRFAQAVEIAMVAVDEAHCISQWGQDFRPSYLRIADFIASLPKRPIISGFTATATPRVMRDIVGILGLNAPDVNVTGFDRPNLYFAVRTTKQKDSFVVDYLKQHADESGIVYCATRKAVDKLCRVLADEGIGVVPYHAGLAAEERTQNQNDFVYDRVSVIVATNAFGMGIDKPDVRFVIHYNMPQSMENYYQEAGRAGRDGAPAQCILLFSGQDVVINRFLLSHKGYPEEDSEQAAQLREADEERLRRMTRYCEGSHCLRHYILNYFEQESENTCGNCGNCLGDLPDYGSAPADMPSRKRRKTVCDDEPTQALFERLRAVRKEIAQANNLAPYMVCSDATLMDMCRRKPQNDGQMLAVSGIGRAKLESFGERFMEEIRAFCMESPDTPPKTAPKRKKTPFYLTEAEASDFSYMPLCTAGELRDAANALSGKDCKKLYATELAAIFREAGFLELRQMQNGATENYPTPDGLAMGITIEEKTGERGTVYHILRYPEPLQRLAISRLIKS